MAVSPSRLGRGLLLLLLPALTLVAAERHRAVRGPFFTGPNQDPSYSYLLGSLQVASHGTTAFYHHPGLPQQALGAAVLGGGYLAAGRGEGLVRDVLARPESHLRALQLTALAAVLAALAGAGFAVRRRGGTVAALLVQTSPLLGAAGLVSLSNVGPEPWLLAATLGLSAVVWRFAAAPPGDERAAAVGFGTLAAFALATRLSAATFVVVPLLLLTTWRGRAWFAAAVAAGGGVALPLIAGYWRDFLGWTLFVGGRTGSWGSPPRSVLDPGLYADGLGFVVRRHHALFALLAAAAAVWLWHRLRRREDAGGLFGRALGAVLAAQAAQVVMVAKTPADRYLVPATALGGLALALVWVLLTGGAAPRRDRWRTPVAAALLLLPLALELPRHRAELDRLRRGVFGQRAIAAEIARLPAGCTVAEFFRASSLPFALHFGHRVRPTVFAEELAELYPGALFYDYRRRRFESFAGPIPTPEVTRQHPCLALHGFYLPELAPQLIRKAFVENLYGYPSREAVVGSPGGCVPGPTTLCLGQGRFAVEVEWATADAAGAGSVVPGGTEKSANFWFFAPDNWEMLFKLLDGCGVNDHYWVYFAATTDVELAVTVTDTRTETVRRYSNPLGTRAQPVADTAAFATCP